MNEQTQLRAITIKVKRVDNDSQDFIVEHESGRLFRLPQLPFQIDAPKPKELPCIEEVSQTGEITVRQNVKKLIKQFYSIGDEADFIVQRAIGSHFVLQDPNGITVKIPRAMVPNPALTPKLRCRVIGFSQKGLVTELVEKILARDISFTLSESELNHYIGDTPLNTHNLRQLLLDRNVGAGIFVPECHKLLTAMTAGQDAEVLNSDLFDLKNHLLNALESSNMLTRCTAIERPLLESRFTDVIEQVGYFQQAQEMLNNGEAEDKITSVLDKLDKSCYLYHPQKNFYILICIFQLNEACMHKYMPRVIEVIRRHDVTLWKREPFLSLWIKLLECYVVTCYKKHELLSSDRKVVANMVFALATQQNLTNAGQSIHFDSVLNRSILLRLCSRLNTFEPQKLLEESLANLVSGGDTKPLYGIDVEDVDITANILANQVGDILDGNADPVYYEGDKARLNIKDGKISISGPDVNHDNVYTIGFARQNLWHGLTIRLAERPPADIRADSSNTIKHYKQLWDFVYKSIFSHVSVRKPKEKRRLMDGEEVNIIVRRRLNDEKQIFECEIIDEGHEGVTGTLDAINHLVPYYPGKLALSDFEKDSNPLVLPARVRMADDETISFDLRKNIKEFMEDYRVYSLNFNSRLTCVLNNRSAFNHGPAISTEGLMVMVYIERGTSFDVLAKGKVVEVYQPRRGQAPYINATYLRDLNDSNFKVSRAVHKLLTNYAYDEVYIKSEAGQNDFQDTLDEEYVYELMNVIEAYAGIENDYLKAYNYISFCRIIARMLKVDREQYYVKRLSLIELLNDFAINNTFTDESLRLFNDANAESFATDSSLYREYRRMQLVSWLDTDDHVEKLYQFIAGSEEPSLQQIASLVLSHNLVKKSGLLQQASDILNRIRQLLQLRIDDTDKKYYGRESFTTEFKTSLVYPEHSMHADIAAQTSKVLSEICAFLNAEGGTLYLGVNDQGYEFGLDEDLKLKLFDHSIDRYEDYLNDQIANRLSQEAAHYVHTRWDNEAKKNVLIVEIEPCPDPKSLNGVYYERMGKSCRKLKEDYLKSFFENRKLWAKSRQILAESALAETSSVAVTPDAATTSAATAPDATTPDVTTSAVTSPDVTTLAATAPDAATSVNQPSSEFPQNTTVKTLTPKIEKIQTSRYRNNVIHDYEEGYTPAAAYLCFVDKGEFKLIDKDDYQTDDYLLELAIHDEETNGWLLMVYADGNVVKASLHKLIERERGRIYKHYANKKLIYASIVSNGDCLVEGLIDCRGSRRLRFTTIDTISEASMQSGGELLCSAIFDDVFYVDVVDAQNLPDGAPLNPKRTDVGLSLKSVPGLKAAQSLRGCLADNL